MQVEAEESADHLHEYAPLQFSGANSITQGSITYQVMDPAYNTDTNDPTAHAFDVANYFYGFTTVTVASPFVSNVINGGANDYLASASFLNTYSNIGVDPAPHSLPTGVKVINNSWIGTFGAAGTDLDALRRFDYVVNLGDVTSVAGATAGTSPLVWDSYNTIAVVGNQGFSVSGSPLKQHADLSNRNVEASYETGIVSGYATGLLGNAQAAGQNDAMHSYVVRSLLFAGTDKNNYTNPGGGSVGGMDTGNGAGQPDYDSSLAILQAGERPLLPINSGLITGSPVSLQDGWATGNISAGSQDVVLFKSINALTGVTASLNWNVTSQTSGANINTSNAAVIFPNLTLEIRPVINNSNGTYSLGTALSSNLFRSSVSGDNTQYISTTPGLPAGSYAIVITGDPSKLATIGLSYSLSGSFASQWNSSGGGSWGSSSLWTNGIPNGAAAQANLLASPGITSPSTITLDGDRTLGQLTFNNSNGYTIAQGTVPGGTTGQLTFNDAGDSSGTANPLITVLKGNQTISAPIYLPYGVTTNISAGASLTMSGSINALVDLVKTGSGTLTFSGTNQLNVDTNAGTVILSPTAIFSIGSMTANNGGTLHMAAPTGGGILTRTFAGSPFTFSINAGGLVVLDAAAITANRQLIVTNGGLTIAGNLNSWTGKLDLNNNDADLPGANLFNTSNQVRQGYNSGKWNGTGGILSTSAANDSRHLTALGVIQNNQSGSALFTASNPFDGTTPGASDILVKYTYYGDANLNGKVDSTDYTLIDNGYLMHLTGWFNGDFNYDGVINGSDYTLIDNAFNTQGAQIQAGIASPAAGVSTQIAGSVPEPSSLSILLVAGSSLLGRRRRRIH